MRKEIEKLGETNQTAEHQHWNNLYIQKPSKFKDTNFLNKIFIIKCIQLRKMDVIPLVNEPYVNEVTLNKQNLYQIFF